MKDKNMNNTTHATWRKQDKNMVGAETKVRTQEIKKSARDFSIRSDRHEERMVGCGHETERHGPEVSFFHREREGDD